jgi:hypothetical protein
MFAMVLEMVLRLVQMLEVMVVMENAFYVCAVQHCFPET